MLDDVAVQTYRLRMSTATSPQESPQTPPRVLVGRTFRMMREAHKVGLRELAAEVGVSPSHLSRIESGERSPGPDLYERIVDTFSSLPAPEKSA